MQEYWNKSITEIPLNLFETYYKKGNGFEELKKQISGNKPPSFNPIFFKKKIIFVDSIQLIKFKINEMEKNIKNKTKNLKLNENANNTELKSSLNNEIEKLKKFKIEENENEINNEIEKKNKKKKKKNKKKKKKKLKIKKKKNKINKKIEKKNKKKTKKKKYIPLNQNNLGKVFEIRNNYQEQHNSNDDCNDLISILNKIFEGENLFELLERFLKESKTGIFLNESLNKK